MKLVFTPNTSDLMDWRHAADNGLAASATALSLGAPVTMQGADDEAFRDAFESGFPHDALVLNALHGTDAADFPAPDTTPGDREDIRHMVRLKLRVDLARRLGAGLFTYETAKPPVAFDERFGPSVAWLTELGLYAGKRRVRIPASMAALGALRADDVRRVMLAKHANAVGWLYEPACLDDPVAALARAGDYILLARFQARDILDGAFDVAGVVRALGAWFDGPLELVGEVAEYREAVTRLYTLVPDLDTLRSPSDYTKMSFPSSVGRLLIGEGTATIAPSTPHVADANGTWRLRYTVGPSGLGAGARLHIRPGHASDWPMGQTRDPGAPDYVTVALLGEAAARAAVTLTPKPMWAATRGVEVCVTEGRLEPGDVAEVAYGDTGGGSPGFRAQCFEEAAFHLFIAVDAEGDGLFREMPDPPHFPVVGAAPVQVALIAPAVVRPGETFSVLARLEDQYRNVSAGGYGDTLSLRGEGVTGLPDHLTWPEADRAVAWIHGLRCDEEGIFYLFGEDARSGVRGNSTPIKCSATGPRIYWGDIHGHSRLMDGSGTPDENFTYARDVAGLDFFSLADHVDVDDVMCERSNPEQWRCMVEGARRYHAPGRFVTLLGFEIAEEEGDYNIYFREGEGEWYIPATTPWELFRWIRENRYDAIAIPHMTTYPVPTRGYDFNYCDPDLMPLGEIVSMHGAGEYFGGERPLQTCQPGGYLQEALARGHRLGFIGSGDGHHGKPGNMRDRYDGGLVAVFAETLERGAVFDALKQRRCYAATTARILVEFEINRVPMGQELTLWSGERFKHVRILAAGTAPIRLVEVVKNNRVLTRLEGGELVLSSTFTDEEPTHRTEYYYLRVTQDDGQMAWSSPIWVTAGEQVIPGGGA